jgi:3-oxoadipate enol-lactonase
VEEPILIETSTERMIQVDRGHIACSLVGDGPALVLIHAGIADARMWEPQIETLQLRFQVLPYDMRGFGQSSSVTGPFSHHDDLRQLLSALSIDRAHILGLSMGASVAIDFALAFPEMVNRLIISSVLGPPPRSRSLLDAWAAAEEAFERDGLTGVNEIEMHMWVDGPHRAPGQVDPAIRDMVSAMNIEVLQREEDATHVSTPIEPPAAERLIEINAPTLVITGDIDQPDVVEYSDRLAHEIPGARLKVIAGVAHLPNLEVPSLFNDLVVTFLAEYVCPERTL